MKRERPVARPAVILSSVTRESRTIRPASVTPQG